MLHIIDYKKYYGPELVLEIEELHLKQQLYWLKGSNGAGKTTLLQSLAGMIPFYGEVRVDECSLKKQRIVYLKQVNFAPAEPVYPSFLTGLDLIRFYTDTKGKSERLTKLLEELSIRPYLRNKLGTYSNGMTKKLSLALAFAGQPKWLLLDEPFITLDKAAQIVLQEAIMDAKKEGCSFFISSHEEGDLLQQFSILGIANRKLQV